MLHIFVNKHMIAKTSEIQSGKKLFCFRFVEFQSKAEVKIVQKSLHFQNDTCTHSLTLSGTYIKTKSISMNRVCVDEARTHIYLPRMHVLATYTVIVRVALTRARKRF